MFRPATPLSVLLFAALVLLLLSVISVPVVKGIKLATYQGVDFGVFGYCTGSKCSKVMLGYDKGTWIPGSSPSKWRRNCSSTFPVWSRLESSIGAFRRHEHSLVSRTSDNNVANSQ